MSVGTTGVRVLYDPGTSAHFLRRPNPTGHHMNRRNTRLDPPTETPSYSKEVETETVTVRPTTSHQSRVRQTVTQTRVVTLFLVSLGGSRNLGPRTQVRGKVSGDTLESVQRIGETRSQEGRYSPS